MTEINRSVAGGGRSWGSLGLFLTFPVDSELVKVGIGIQPGLSHMHSGAAEATTNFRLLGSSKQVAQGKLEADSDIDLPQSSSQEAPEPTHQVALFRPHQCMTQLAPQWHTQREIAAGTRAC